MLSFLLALPLLSNALVAENQVESHGLLKRERDCANELEICQNYCDVTTDPGNQRRVCLANCAIQATICTPKGDTVLIKHIATGLCVDIVSSWGQGTPYLNNCDQNNTQQQFNTKNWFQGKLNSRSCIYANGPVQNGTPLYFSDHAWCNDGQHHYEKQWYNIRGNFYVEHNGDYCMDTGGSGYGAQLKLWNCQSGNTNQDFKLIYFYK